MTPPEESSTDTAQGSQEAVSTVRERFESYVSDLRTTLEHAARAGTVGERHRSKADRLIREYRERLDEAGDYVAAQRGFDRFKEEAERLRP